MLTQVLGRILQVRYAKSAYRLNDIRSDSSKWRVHPRFTFLKNKIKARFCENSHSDRPCSNRLLAPLPVHRIQFFGVRDCAPPGFGRCIPGKNHVYVAEANAPGYRRPRHPFQKEKARLFEYCGRSPNPASAIPAPRCSHLAQQNLVVQVQQTQSVDCYKATGTWQGGN